MASPDGSSGRVLLIQKRSPNASVFATAARNAGFELLEAVDDVEALHVVAEGQIDLVLSDLHRPVMEGAELLRSIRARSDVPIIFLTAAADQNWAAVQAAELGAAQYLVKPVDRAALERVLQLAVRPRHPERAVPAVFYNRRGERVIPTVFTATDAKKEFARALDIAAQGGMVVVTKHDDARAVLLSVQEFNALVQPATRSIA